jgi:hypothetical protein
MDFLNEKEKTGNNINNDNASNETNIKEKENKEGFQTKGGKHMNEKQKEFYKLYSKGGEEMEGKSWLEIVKQNEVATNTTHGNACNETNVKEEEKE